MRFNTVLPVTQDPIRRDTYTTTGRKDSAHYMKRSEQYFDISKQLNSLKTRPAPYLTQLLHDTAKYGYPTVGQELGVLRRLLEEIARDLELILGKEGELEWERNIQYLFDACASANTVNLRFERRTFQSGAPPQWYEIVNASRRILRLSGCCAIELLKTEPEKLFIYYSNSKSKQNGNFRPQTVRFLQTLAARRTGDGELPRLLCKSIPSAFIQWCNDEDLLRFVYTLKGIGIYPNNTPNSSPLLVAKREVERRVFGVLKKSQQSHKTLMKLSAEIQIPVFNLVPFPLLANALYAFSSCKIPSLSLSVVAAQRLKWLCDEENLSTEYSLDRRSISHFINSVCTVINALSTTYSLRGNHLARDAIVTAYRFLCSEVQWPLFDNTDWSLQAPLRLASIESLRKLATATITSNGLGSPVFGQSPVSTEKILEPTTSINQILSNRNVRPAKLKEMAKIIATTKSTYETFAAKRQFTDQTFLECLEKFEQVYRSIREENEKNISEYFTVRLLDELIDTFGDKHASFRSLLEADRYRAVNGSNF